eukprot:1413736-Karenia_brevis.AAC.1
MSDQFTRLDRRNAEMEANKNRVTQLYVDLIARGLSGSISIFNTARVQRWVQSHSRGQCWASTHIH